MWGIFVLVQIAAPWIVLATIAGVAASVIADREQRASSAWLAVALVLLCALVSSVLPPLRKMQLDRLRFEEASLFCSRAPVRVLKPLAAGNKFRFGIYDSYLGPGEYKPLDFALRSRQTRAGSSVEKVSFVSLKRGEPAPDDVYPVLRHLARDSRNLAVIHPRTAEIIAYTNYIFGHEGETRSRYVGCDRTTDESPTNLEIDELFSMLSVLLAPTGTGAKPAPQPLITRSRTYDIEVGASHEVREDCSRGLTMAPGMEFHYDYRYLRSRDDLVILTLDRAAWDREQAKEVALAKANRAPVLWQHYSLVVTCKNYFSDDTKAGPVFHPGGYEEPASRVRALGKTPYFPFDYGPHRMVRCVKPIETGPVRPAWHYVLKRDGNHLIIAELTELHGTPIKITPLITCEGYFDPPSGSAPDVRLGAGGSTREIFYPASRVLQMRDGDYLGERAGSLAERLRETAEQRVAVSAPRPAPAPVPTAEKRRREPTSPWPAKPR